MFVFLGGNFLRYEKPITEEFIISLLVGRARVSRIQFPYKAGPVWASCCFPGPLFLCQQLSVLITVARY